MSQSRERRQALAQVRSCLGRADSLTRKKEATISDLGDALDDFHKAAIIARLPARLVNLHHEVQVFYWIIEHVGDRAANRRGSPVIVFLADNTNQLLYALIWHPWLTRFYSWYRIWRYVKLFSADTRLRDDTTRDIIQQLSEDYGIFPFGRKEYREIIRASRRLKKETKSQKEGAKADNAN
jgi:hypothetical protein